MPETTLFGEPQTKPHTAKPSAKDLLLQQFVDRFENAMIEAKHAADDLKQITADCKDEGFVAKTIAAMKTVAKLRMTDKGEEAREKLATLEEVSRAVGFDLFSWSEDLNP